MVRQAPLGCAVRLSPLSRHIALRSGVPQILEDRDSGRVCCHSVVHVAGSRSDVPSHPEADDQQAGWKDGT